MTRNVKFATLPAFVSLKNWVVNMHEEGALFPSTGCDVEKCNFVSASVFVFDSELVAFEEVVI